MANRAAIYKAWAKTPEAKELRRLEKLFSLKTQAEVELRAIRQMLNKAKPKQSKPKQSKPKQSKPIYSTTQCAIYSRNRRENDALFKLRLNLASRLYRTFKAIGKDKKPHTTNILLGTTYANVKVHIEQQFTEGMGWHNQGAWHIDHIIPCASAMDEEALIKLCHYTNLQPLWAADNLVKGAKVA